MHFSTQESIDRHKEFAYRNLEANQFWFIEYEKQFKKGKFKIFEWREHFNRFFSHKKRYITKISKKTVAALIFEGLLKQKELTLPSLVIIDQSENYYKISVNLEDYIKLNIAYLLTRCWYSSNDVNTLIISLDYETFTQIKYEGVDLMSSSLDTGLASRVMLLESNSYGDREKFTQYDAELLGIDLPQLKKIQSKIEKDVTYIKRRETSLSTAIYLSFLFLEECSLEFNVRYNWDIETDSIVYTVGDRIIRGYSPNESTWVRINITPCYPPNLHKHYISNSIFTIDKLFKRTKVTYAGTDELHEIYLKELNLHAEKPRQKIWDRFLLYAKEAISKLVEEDRTLGVCDLVKDDIRLIKYISKNKHKIEDLFNTSEEELLNSPHLVNENVTLEGADFLDIYSSTTLSSSKKAIMDKVEYITWASTIIKYKDKRGSSQILHVGEHNSIDSKLSIGDIIFDLETSQLFIWKRYFIKPYKIGKWNDIKATNLNSRTLGAVQMLYYHIYAVKYGLDRRNMDKFKEIIDTFHKHSWIQSKGVQNISNRKVYYSSMLSLLEYCQSSFGDYLKNPSM